MVAKMKNKSEIGFAGLVEPANCECHKGQFMAVAFLIHPTQGRIHLANNAFPTEAAANAELDNFVKAVAYATLREMGIEPLKAAKVTVTHNDEAMKSEQRYMNAHNENLH